MERQTNSDEPVSVFTVGHSNHAIEVFLGLLERHGIEVLVDTRSFPFSKFATQFDQNSLRASLKHVGIKYLFLGRELGGKPKEPMFYDEEGYVLYWKIAQSLVFQDGIARVLKGIRSYRVALLCSEENPLHCHRRLLVGRVLRHHGTQVWHIRGNGTLESEDSLISMMHAEQMNIFSSVQEDEQWKSIQSVSRKRTLLSSSNQ